jgi:hypothetical protein
MLGMPSDEDILAVSKYLAPRMKEWRQADVKGLTIITHQRHLPALDSNNESAFRDDVLTNAEEQDLGLLTAWDLFRLLRGYLKNGWQPDRIMPLVYKSGLISPVPEHYDFVGVVERFIESIGVVGVKIVADRIRRGDCIAFELPVEFYEQNVESPQVDNVQVDEAKIGSIVGIKTKMTKRQVKLGTRVFRVLES